MFFEFKIDGRVVLLNLALVTRITVDPPNAECAHVHFTFTDGREEAISLSPVVVQRLYTALPRPAIYGGGGTG
ncbi:MAG: hypothetical protein K2V38_08810 [Gemmataceae bacterium]|nr:hypothetical protein [Gemmataceae bacterium]